MAKRKSKRIKNANGAGSVIQRGDGRWMARYSTTDPETGLPVRKTLYGHSDQEARAKLIEALAAQQSGNATFTRGRGLTLAQWAERWLVSKRSRTRPKTQAVYRLLMGHATASLGQIRLSALEPRHINGLLATKRREGLSERSCNHIRAVVRACLQDAMREGLVMRNVAELARPLALQATRREEREQKERRVEVIEGKLAAFLQLTEQHPDGSLWLVALATGCRQSELTGLRWSDVDLEHCQISITRTLQRVDGNWLEQEPKSDRSTRTIPLPRAACDALRRQRATVSALQLRAKRWSNDYGELVFPGERGRPLDGVSATKRLQAAMRAAELPHIRFHDLRHMATSLLESAGVSARVRMELLGHSQIQTTQNVYTDVVNASQRDAADAMDRALNRA